MSCRLNQTHTDECQWRPSQATGMSYSDMALFVIEMALSTTKQRRIRWLLCLLCTYRQWKSISSRLSFVVVVFFALSRPFRQFMCVSLSITFVFALFSLYLIDNLLPTRHAFFARAQKQNNSLRVRAPALLGDRKWNMYIFQILLIIFVVGVRCASFGLLFANMHFPTCTGVLAGQATRGELSRWKRTWAVFLGHTQTEWSFYHDFFFALLHWNRWSQCVQAECALFALDMPQLRFVRRSHCNNGGNMCYLTNKSESYWNQQEWIIIILQPGKWIIICKIGKSGIAYGSLHEMGGGGISDARWESFHLIWLLLCADDFCFVVVAFVWSSLKLHGYARINESRRGNYDGNYNCGKKNLCPLAVREHSQQSAWKISSNIHMVFTWGLGNYFFMRATLAPYGKEADFMEKDGDFVLENEVFRFESDRRTSWLICKHHFIEREKKNTHLPRRRV